MADTNVGKVTQIVGAVIDAKFTEGKLPEIHDAITIATKSGDTLYAEVSQHLGMIPFVVSRWDRQMVLYVVWKRSVPARRLLYLSVKQHWDVCSTCWDSRLTINRLQR